MIIGITGTDGAGKGSVVDYLVEKYGFTHYSSRSFIVDEIERQGLPVSRNQMRLTANQLRKEYGNDFVVRQAYEKAAQDGNSNVVIESIRAYEEAQYLLDKGGVLVAVDADQLVRYERVQQRRSASDQVSFEEFCAHEELEKNDPDPHGMQKAKVMNMALYTIYNDDTIAILHQRVDELLTVLQSPHTIDKV